MNKKIKIGYYCADVNPYNTKSIGIYKITKEILRCLLNSNKFEVFLILSNGSKKFFKEFNCKKVIKRQNHLPYSLNKLFFYPNFANKVARKNGLEILFFPKGHIPFIKNKKTKYVSIINDLIPWYYLKKGRVSMIFSLFLLFGSIKSSDLIMTISDYSKFQIEKITKKKIEVIPLGCRTVKPKDASIRKPYVFVIGNKNPHKNLNRSIELIKEYNQLRNTNYQIAYSLGGLSEEEIAGYYQGAEFSLFLSDIEGFGLPLIESYNYGAPVVFNNKTSLAELGRGLPGACDVNNKNSVFDAIDKIRRLNNKEITSIKSRLNKRYNWNSCGKQVIKNLINLS